MFLPLDKSREKIFSQIHNSKISLSVDSKNFQELIHPKELLLVVPIIQFATTITSQELFDDFSTSVKNFTKKWLLFSLAEEIRKLIDDNLKSRISEDEYLGRVLVRSMVEIKSYLVKLGRKHKLEAFIWYDIEDTTWEETIISVKIECKDNKEKRKIWDDIDKIVRKHEDEGVIVLTQVDRYELS